MLMDDHGSLSHTREVYASASEEKNVEFFCVILTQLWNAVIYSKCKNASQNLRREFIFPFHLH